jgi:UDP-N-acetylmuramate--L-alanine ligase
MFALKTDNRQPATKYYFLGIAGQAMSGLAVAAKHKGYIVTGVAVGAYPPATDALEEAGIHFYPTYDKSHIQQNMTVILGNGIAVDNEELLESQRLKLNIQSFPELLEDWTAHQDRIVVAGTHGKTTTTTMIAWLLQSAGREVDFMTGMASHDFAVSVRHQGAPVVVIEGDEYATSNLNRRSKFEYYHPQTLVITSLEWDHPDLFPTFDLLRQRFEQLVASLPTDGLLVANADDSQVMALAQHAPCKVITFSTQGIADYQAKNILFEPHQTRFTWWQKGQDRGEFTISLAGVHNVANVLAALAAVDAMQLPVAFIAKGLLSFVGAKRRFEVVGVINGVTIIDDYAHHPTEVAATLAAARLRYPGARVWAFFTPHTYSRTSALLTSYATAFISADFVLLSEVEAAREVKQLGDVGMADVLAQLPKQTAQVHYLVDPPQARQLLVENVSEGDVVVCMSVSGANNLALSVVAGLKKRWPES